MNSTNIHFNRIDERTQKEMSETVPNGFGNKMTKSIS